MARPKFGYMMIFKNLRKNKGKIKSRDLSEFLRRFASAREALRVLRAGTRLTVHRPRHFAHVAFLKNRRKNKAKMNVLQFVGFFSSSTSVSGGHQVDGLPPVRSNSESENAFLEALTRRVKSQGRSSARRLVSKLFMTSRVVFQS